MKLVNEAIAAAPDVTAHSEGMLKLAEVDPALYVVIMTIIIVIGALVHMNKQWSQAVDKVAQRQDNTQKETNDVLRGLTTVITEVKTEIYRQNNAGTPNQEKRHANR